VTTTNTVIRPNTIHMACLAWNEFLRVTGAGTTVDRIPP
jgi:hypothetical protein